MVDCVAVRLTPAAFPRLGSEIANPTRRQIMSLEESDKAAAAVQKAPNRVTLEQLENKIAEKHFATAAAAVGIDYGRDWDAHYENEPQPLSPPEVTTLCIVVTTKASPSSERA